MPKFSKFTPKRISSNLLILMTAGLCFWVGIASLLPVIPLYVQDIGGSEQQVGFVMGAFAIGLILARPQLGTRADHHSRKQVLLIGLVVGGLAPLGYLLTQFLAMLPLPEANIPALRIQVLFGLRAFHGISIAAFTTAYTAYVVDQAEPKRRTEILGYTSLVTPIGIGVGPVMGGFVQAKFGYETLFLISSGLAWIGFLCISTLDEPKRNQPPVNQRQASNWWRLIKGPLRLFLDPRLRVLSFVMLCAGSTFGTLSTFMPLYVKQLGLAFNPGYYYLFAAVASFTMRLVTGRVAQRFGKGRFISLSLICYGLSMILLWQGEKVWALMMSGLLEGAAGGLLIPTVSAIVADRSRSHERGQVFSICLGGFDLGIALAGPLFGLLVPDIGLQNVFLGASTISIVSLTIFMLYGNQTVMRSLQFAFGREPDHYALSLTQQES